MKKVLALIMAAFLIVGLLAGCGTGKSQAGSAQGETAVSGTANSGDAAAGKDTKGVGNSNLGKTGVEYTEGGVELTDYTNALSNAEKPFADLFEKSLTDPDMDTLSAQMTLAMPELALALLGEYDVLSIGDMPKKEGKLMLSGYHAVREKKGKVIKFTADMEYTEDTGMNKKGDKITEKGSLDMSTSSLTYERKVENGGNLLSRTIIETVILKDGTCIMQYISTGSGLSENATGEAVFKRYNSSGYTALVASMDANTGFKYDSVIGKGDIQPDAMAANYTIKTRFTVKDGKAEVTKQ
jgi:hypothetical protein